jgi:hypothetical protein
MAQLKNCCLGGLKAGTEREGKQRSHQRIQSSLSPFSYFNQLSLSRDIINPIIID